MTAPLDHGARVHNILGGSSADRWLVCPGYKELKRVTPDQPSTAVMRSGTETHEHMEKAMRWARANLPEVENLRMMAACGHKQLIEGITEKDRAARVVEGVRQYCVLLEMIAEAEGANVHAWPEWFEPELPLDGIALDPGGDCGPACDFVAGYSWGPGLVVDYKDGKKSVPATDNPQNALAAVLAAKRFGFTRVLTAIVQPGIHPEPRFWWMEAEDLAAWELRFRKAIDRTHAEPTVYVGGPHCDWCPCQATCPGQHKVADDLFGDLPGLDKQVLMATAMTVAKASYVAPADVLKRAEFMVLNATRLRKMLDAVEAWVLRRKIADQTAFPDLKLVSGRAGNRAWNNVDAMLLAAKFGGITATVEAPMSPTALEKADPKGYAELKEYVARKAPGLALAPIADKRPAVTPGDGSDLFLDDTDSEFFAD
jgi:hypothetical protein